MNLLDMRTVLLSYIISNAICAAVMASLWWQNRRRSPELAFWLADFIMQFAGVLLLATRGSLPDFFSIVLANTLIVGGTLLLFIGLERYTRKAGPQWHNHLYMAAFIFVQMYFVFIRPSMLVRTVNISLGVVVFCSQAAWLLLRRVEPSIRKDTWGTGAVFVAFSLVSLIRIFVDLTIAPENDLFKSGLYDTLCILTFQILYIGLTFALFLMVNRRLLTTLENDITERKLAEEALKISEEKFSKAFQTSPYAITITRVEDGRFIEVNDAFTSITGVSHKEALADSSIGLKLWVNEEDRQHMVSALRAGEVLAGQEFLFRRKNGEVLTGLFSAQIIQLNLDPCILSSINDITERKQAEEALHQSHSALRKAQQVAHVGSWAWHIQSNRLEWSDEMYLIFGIEKENFTGDLAEVVNRSVHPDDRAAVEASNLSVVKDNKPIPLEYRVVWPDGTVHVVWAEAGEMVLDQEGSIVTLTGIVQDITERKRIEQQLVNYTEKLEVMVDERTRELREAQERVVRHETLAVLGQLAGSVGHELRNPLGIINSAVYFLKLTQPNADEKTRQYLVMIEKEIRNADKIIGDLLDFARVKSAECEVVSVPELIRQTLERFPAPASVEVSLDLPTDLPQVFVDPRHMTQVLGNLTVNACQAMKDGGQLIVSGDQFSVTSTSLSTSQWVRIAVKDTGIGIPPENMGKLFEPLFTTKPKGIGLGLAVSKKLVEANGGRIEVESKAGKGSTFTLVLPVRGG